jgi:serine phosphatase RsbU (regulator of sigma subunit)
LKLAPGDGLFVYTDGIFERVRTFAVNAVQADDIAAMGLRFVK